MKVTEILKPGEAERLRALGRDPEWAFACQEVSFPIEEGKEPPDDLLQAVRFATDSKLGDAIVLKVNKDGICPSGRRPIIKHFTGDYWGEAREHIGDGLRKMTYLVGFTEQEGTS